MLREETEMLVFVIRHAQQEHGQGSDPPLAEAGRAQAARLAQAFPGQRLDRVVCSTMRARHGHRRPRGRQPRHRHHALSRLAPTYGAHLSFSHTGIWELAGEGAGFTVRRRDDTAHLESATRRS